MLFIERLLILLLLVIFIVLLVNFLTKAYYSSLAIRKIECALKTNSIIEIKNALILNEKFLDKELIEKINSRVDDLVIEKDGECK